jgi:hypothetical protein
MWTRGGRLRRSVLPWGIPHDLTPVRRSRGPIRAEGRETEQRDRQRTQPMSSPTGEQLLLQFLAALAQDVQERRDHPARA